MKIKERLTRTGKAYDGDLKAIVAGVIAEGKLCKPTDLVFEIAHRTNLSHDAIRPIVDRQLAERGKSEKAAITAALKGDE